MTGSGSEKCITLSIDSLLRDVFLVGLAIRGYAEYLGFNESDAGLLELAVVEAVTNTIEHALAGKPGHQLDVSVTILSRSITVAISYTGSAFSNFGKGAAVKEFSEVFDLPERGWGVPIIKQVMDDVTHESIGDRQVLTLKKSLPEMG